MYREHSEQTLAGPWKETDSVTLRHSGGEAQSLHFHDKRTAVLYSSRNICLRVSKATYCFCTI